MDAEERRRTILELARHTGSVVVTELAEKLGVSKETVRRDLHAMENRGLLRRTHGGAYPVESAGYETTLAFRTTMHVAEKSRIAAAAGEMVGDAETIYVDEGFTPQLIAQALPRERPLTVITSSLATASGLAVSDRITVLLLGGRVRGGTLASVGHWATHMLQGFVIDLAFIGANGISRQYGLTTPDPAVSEVKAQVMRVARRRIFAGVHTKFGAVSFCRFGEAHEFEVIITDTGLPLAEAHRYALLGPQVLRV